MNDLTPASYDLAKKPGMDMQALLRLLEDIENQPEWRADSDRAARFYDGKQLDLKRLEELQASGEPPTVVNLIFGAINGALGQEARTRLDWHANADSDAFQDVADVLNVKLKEAQRETGADLAVSNAYKGQIVPGIGWVHVSRNPDPLAYPYRVEDVHRNEVWWDWRARRIDKQDGSWMCRQRWVDEDEAISAMPQFRRIFEWGCSSSALSDRLRATIATTDGEFADIHDTRRSFNRYEEEWLDNAGRKRIRFYQVWYKERQQAVAIVSGTTRVRFNPRNPLHQEAVKRGIAYLVKGPSYRIREAMFAGPFRLWDEPIKSRMYPLIPFLGFEDDEFATPYGLAKGMIDPQQEYNERRSRLRWLLKAVQAFVDNDALDERYNNFKQFAAEIMRPDSVTVLNAARRNGAQAVRVEHNVSLKKEQFEAMQDSKMLIQEQPRIYSTMLGDAPTGVTSGTAINSLVEQGMVALGETNDNYRGSRTAVGNALAELILEDLQRPNFPVVLGKGKSARTVFLNTFDPQTGLPVNMVEDAPVKLGLGDVPSTPAYRMQQQNVIGQALGQVGNDPIARAVLVPAFIESTDIPNREQSAEWLRKQYGAPNPSDPPKAREQAEAEQQAQMQRQQDATIKKLEAEVDQLHANVAKLITEVELNEAKLAQMNVQTDQMELQTDQMAAEGDSRALIDDALNEAEGAEA